VIGYDGRSFIIDGEALLANIKANGLDIPLDANHNFDEALGWFDQESFEVRKDGIYASLEFTPKGIEANQNRSYRYLSPVYIMGNGRTVVGLDSVGFVNRPNLLNNALNNKEQENMTIEELKQQQDALTQSLADFSATVSDKLKVLGESIASFETNATSTKKEIAALKTELNSVKDKVAIFAKGGEYDQNNNSTELTDGEKAAAKVLGLSEEEYKNAKGGK